MTEEECLDQLRHDPTVSDRKLRLFAAACCRRAWHLFAPLSRVAIETSERFADGAATCDQLLCADYGNREVAPGGILHILGSTWETMAKVIAANAVHRPVELSCVRLILEQLPIAVRENPHSWESWFGWNKARRAHIRYLQCVFALAKPEPHDRTTPFPVSPTCIDLAQAIYTDRTFDQLPILADALEDAGCTNTAVLDHCRQPGEHIRGCWVVDRVLGRE